MNRHDLAFVALGGAIGSMLRHMVQETWPASSGAFPTSTLALNLGGAFLLGLVVELVARQRHESRWMRPLLGIGVLGATTTFGGLAVEGVLLIRDGAPGVAAAYLVVTIAGGLVAAVAGLLAGGWRAPEDVPSEGES